jgi:eukaryotic-like serine/threonine-protein kinase
MRGSTLNAPGVSPVAAGRAVETAGAADPSGSWLAGRYELHDAVGNGGMGTVYRARDRVLDRTVAVKLLPLVQASDRGLVARFEREARAAASLCHPNVVSVYDAGSDASTRFIVMEFVGGVSLAELLQRHRRLPVERAVDLSAQIASGLAAAHRAGVVHRDVKPANVMVNESGTVKLLDFGIADAGASTSLTQAGSVLGSAHYIPPEVVQGGAATERADVYSLGCVLYEMVTGRPPFAGELGAALLHQHASSAPRPPSSLAGGIPRKLDELIMKMLAKRPADRPPSAQLARLLEGSARSDTRARAPRRAGHRAEARATETLPAFGRPPRRRARLALAAAALAALVAIGVAIAAASGNAADSSQNAASAADVHSRGSAHPAERQSWSLPRVRSGFAEAARLVAAAVAGLEAASAPTPVVAPPRKAAAKHKARRARPHPKHRQRQASAKGPSSEGGEAPPTPSGETPSTPSGEAQPTPSSEAEAPPPTGETQVAPAQPAPEAPPAASTTVPQGG